MQTKQCVWNYLRLIEWVMEYNKRQYTQFKEELLMSSEHQAWGTNKHSQKCCFIKSKVFLRTNMNVTPNTKRYIHVQRKANSGVYIKINRIQHPCVLALLQPFQRKGNLFISLLNGRLGGRRTRKVNDCIS